jgi:hypothetical protein
MKRRNLNAFRGVFYFPGGGCMTEIEARLLRNVEDLRLRVEELEWKLKIEKIAEELYKLQKLYLS